LLMRHEVRRFTGARLSGPVPDFERRRFTRRMLGVAILTVVLAMTYFGYMNKEGFKDHPWFFAVYWITCFILLFSLIGLALLDARAFFKNNLKKYMDEEGESERLEQFLMNKKDKG